MSASCGIHSHVIDTGVHLVGGMRSRRGIYNVRFIMRVLVFVDFTLVENMEKYFSNSPQALDMYI